MNPESRTFSSSESRAFGSESRTREVAALMAAVRALLADRRADEPPAPGEAPVPLDIIARFDRDLRYLEVSPAALGWSAALGQDCIGKTSLQLGLPSEMCESWNAALQRVFATGRPEKMVLSVDLPDGRRCYDCRLLPEPAGAGEVASVVSVARDFTELKKAYDAESRTRDVADALLEASLVLASRLDRDNVLITLLRSMRRVVPFDRGTVMVAEEGGRVSIRATYNGAEVVPVPREDRLLIDPADHPLVERIFEEGETIVVADESCHPDWSLPLDGKEKASWMGVPLRAEGEVAGLFSLAKFETGFFTDEHRRLAELLSVQASVAVENAILYDRMQVSNRHMRSLSRRLVAVQENERRHIARELHDDAGQALVSLRYGLRLLEKEVGTEGPAAEHVAELRRRTDTVMDSLHRLAVDLRPASLDHLGLDAALRQYASSAGSKYNLAVRYKARGFEPTDRLPSAVETNLYRVVQEAMTNVVRHARATRVDLMLERRDDRVIVIIEDDGVGFDPSRLPRNDHLGLIGLRERAEALSGTLTVESSPGSGTTIVVEVSSADPNPDR